MADDIENHTLRLLQEMRGEMREGFAGLPQRMDVMERRQERTKQRQDRMELWQDRMEHRVGILEGSAATLVNAVTEIARVQEKHSGLLLEQVESNRISGARLPGDTFSGRGIPSHTCIPS
jgi:hypothetical protein